MKEPHTSHIRYIRARAIREVLPTGREVLPTAVERRVGFSAMGAVCGRFFGDAERTSPEMTSGWMPTYGSGKGDEPMMSGKLFKRSSLHGTFQPRHFELLLNKQTGEVSSTGQRTIQLKCVQNLCRMIAGGTAVQKPAREDRQADPVESGSRCESLPTFGGVRVHDQPAAWRREG